jgi:hypothetical protein
MLVVRGTPKCLKHLITHHQQLFREKSMVEFEYYQKTMRAEARAEPFLSYIRYFEAIKLGGIGTHA